MKESVKTVDVVQLGGREHYTLPKMFNEMGLLRYLHTDFLADTTSSFPAQILNSLPKALKKSSTVRRMLDRKAGLPDAKVKSHPFFGIKYGYQKSRITDEYKRTQYLHKSWQQFANIVGSSVKNPADVTVGFRGVLPLFRKLEGTSKRILWQNDGGYHEVEVVRKELVKNIDWINKPPEWLKAGDEEPYWLKLEKPRLNEEWDESDLIVCNSAWTARCLAEAGVVNTKVTTIPISYEPPTIGEPRSRRCGRLRIGFLGTLTLRKGIHHLCEAALMASQSEDIEISCAGGLQISEAKLARYSAVVSHKGNLPRSDVKNFLDSIDVLVLPSISEGFGIVQLEAMSQGLPVISSDRTGDVVIDGVNGIRFKSGDITALASAMVRLARDRSELEYMSIKALERALEFSREAVARDWSRLLK